MRLEATGQGERLPAQGSAPPRTRWTLEVRADGASGSTTGPLGVVYRCVAETPLSDPAVAGHVLGLRVESVTHLVAQAALRLRPPPTWTLPCPPPSPRWTALYASSEALYLGDDQTDAPDGPTALGRLPGAEAWLRDSLDRPLAALAPDAPVHRPLLRGFTLPSGMHPATADAQTAYTIAAVTGLAVDAALARSLWSSVAGFAPQADARLLARLREGEPLLVSTLRRALAEGSPGRPEIADAVWGRMLGQAVALDPDTDAAMTAALGRCAAADTREHCGPWTYGALAAYLGRRQDDPGLLRLVRATVELPRDWRDPGTRSEVRVEALRAAQAGRAAPTAIEAARAVVAGADDGPLRTGRCVGVGREVVRAECRDPRMVAAAMLVGDCAPASRQAAEAGLRTERPIAVGAAACVLVRCGGEAEARTTLERVRPGHRFNGVAMALVPRWCRGS